MAQNIPTILSVIALAISIITSVAGVYLEFLRVRGPKVILLNDRQDQQSVPASYDSIPPTEKDMFPFYPEENPGYATLDLLFANSGDRVAFVHIKRIDGQLDGKITLKAAYYNHVSLPPSTVVDHQASLRNIPLTDKAITVNLTVIVDWGGVGARGKLYVEKDVPYQLTVTLGPRY